MPTQTTPAQLERNRTKRLATAPEPRPGEVALWRRINRKPVLRCETTRKSRKVRAHFRSMQGIGGKAKHMKVFMNAVTNEPRMNKQKRTLDGSPLAPHAKPEPQDPYVARATAKRPWAERRANRARNKRARLSRKANR